jgi:hypothetical protein
VDSESLEAIHADYLKGQEMQAQGLALQLSAFNRLLALHEPVIPIATHVQVERIRQE